MSAVRSDFKVSAVLHWSRQLPYSEEQFIRILDTLLNQAQPLRELIILNHDDDRPLEFETQSVQSTVVSGAYESQSEWLNAALKRVSADYLLYLDNLTAELFLKRSYLDVAELCVAKYPDLGMLYGDYELMEKGRKREIRLLKHHAGRLRDNQDYGKLFLFSKRALEDVGGFDSAVRFHPLYDIRLKLSVNYEMVHVANKFAGSLYRVVAEGQKHNVFDYLLAGKEVQQEAERVLSAHLKSIGAYLEPGFNYRERPGESKEYEYIASVVIPVNNRPEFIATALSSVFNQTEQNIEVIVVVNGGRDDPTVKEVDKYVRGGALYDEDKPPVRLVVSDINNIGFSLNLGIRAARGKYYIQLDSDDRLKPDAIEKVLQVFQSDIRIGLVIGSYEVWEKRDSGEFVRMDEIPVVTHAEWTAQNGRNNLLHINGAGAPRCIPIAVIEELGYFGINDEPYARNYGEDYDLVLKISERHRVGRIYDPIYEVVRHSGGTDHSIDQETIDRNDEAKDYMRLMAVRRRQQLVAGD